MINKIAVEKTLESVENTNQATSGNIFQSLGINWISFIFYLICFAITFIILNKFLFKPLLQLVENREKQINSTIQKEKEYETSLNQLAKTQEDLKETSYREKSKAILEGKQEGQDIKSKIIADSEKQAKEIQENAVLEAKKEIGILRSQVERETLQMWNDLLSENLSNYSISKEEQKIALNELLKKPFVKK
jgi:F-type H+-transporting ATPase subunit b